MALPFHGTTVTRLRPTTVTDDYNNKTLSWDDPDEATYPAHAQPTGSSETRGAKERNQVTTNYTFWLDPGADVANGDRLQWGDLLLDVVGDPLTYVAPYAGSHVEVRATVSKG